MRIIGIGGCNLDILGVPEGEMILRDSNPGKVTLRAGGVTHNILRRLTEKKHETALITVLGTGPLAETLRELCAGEGISLDYALRADTQPGTYLCLHERNGDVLCAVNAMQAMELLTPEKALAALEKAGPADAYVADTNLREDTLEAVCAFVRGKGLLFLDPVSAHKGYKAEKVYPLLDAFKPNRLEAEKLSGCRDVTDAAEYFCRQGVKNVFISLGAAGIYYRSGNEHGLCRAQPLTGSPLLTGAGDALCAGIIDALLRGGSAEDAAVRGNLWAHETLEA